MDQRDVVSREDLERELRAIEALAPGQIEGVFGRASLTWRVYREAAIFLGAGRALLLQLAHPYVAATIAEHSRTLADPIGRFHRTFNITFTLVVGTLDQALRAARHLHQRHSAIQGLCRRLLARLPRAPTIRPTMSRRCVGFTRRWSRPP
jgi:uncharacterized protein (DUF2236 family)